ncbi:MAG: TfoX/Sxy family protein [Lawsonibacter sp.]|nr:TfoX/Sxy family protein [Lawsonibacter sp.]
MSSSLDFVHYVCEQLEGVGAIRSRKMFGEYMVYVNDKPVVMVCDDTVFVKMLPCLADLLADRPTAPLYEGAKDHYVLDPDDRETLRRAAELAEEVTPLPKKKPPREAKA